MGERPPLRVLIVDDEAPARSRVRDLLADCSRDVPLAVCGEAASGREAIELAQRVPCDVVLLDVRMPEMDGIEVAQHLMKLERPPSVIFATAYDAYALKAFEVHAVDYLLKPIRASRLTQALKRVPGPPPAADALREMQRAPRTHLSAHERGRVNLIPIDDVLYLKAELKYVTVRTASHEHVIEEPLARLEEEYGERFVRVHRNCLVARAAVRGFERAGNAGGEAYWVVLIDGLDEKLAVSRRQQHIVREFTKGGAPHGW